MHWVLKANLGKSSAGRRAVCPVMINAILMMKMWLMECPLHPPCALSHLILAALSGGWDHYTHLAGEGLTNGRTLLLGSSGETVDYPLQV